MNPLDQVRYGINDSIDMDEVRRYRLERVREQLRLHDYGACVLADPINIRYATDSRNMQVWVAHNAVRYVFIPCEGPVVLFDFHNCEHLSQGLGSVDEVRPGTGVYYFGAGSRMQELAARWAAEIADLVDRHGGGNRRLALDHAHHYAVTALERHAVEIFDAQQLLEQARLIKCAGELQCMRVSIAVCQQAMQDMHEQAEPGMTENQVWSILHRTNIALGGEWIETRLLTSGERTNPWFQECGFRTLRQGDLISYDTDLIGPYGYCADLSRSFVCAARATDRQRQLYAMAYQQIHENIALLQPGMGLREFAERSYRLPASFRNNRYSVIAHGVGLCDEYPVILYPQDFGHSGYDDVIRPGMTLCIESYIGEDGGEQGVKLEQQVLIGETGVELLSDFAFDEDLLGREL